MNSVVLLNSLVWFRQGHMEDIITDEGRPLEHNTKETCRFEELFFFFFFFLRKGCVRLSALKRRGKSIQAGFTKEVSD